MDNPQQQNLGTAAGDISAIRNILMGNHIAEYSSKFKEISETFSVNDKDKDERFQKLEAEINNRLDTMEKEMNERFEKLEALVAQNVERLHERVNAVSTTDKADLGRLLAEVSNRLVNG